MEQKIIAKTEEELIQLVDLIRSSKISSPKIVLLQGDLGAGKTAFVKQFMDRLGCADQVSSPTFSLVNVYECQEIHVVHMDLYRLEDLEEIEEMGFWDYLEQAEYAFIEWPNKITNLLPQEQVISVDINVNLQGWRELLVSY